MEKGFPSNFYKKIKINQITLISITTKIIKIKLIKVISNIQIWKQQTTKFNQIKIFKTIIIIMSMEVKKIQKK